MQLPILPDLDYPFRCIVQSCLTEPLDILALITLKNCSHLLSNNPVSLLARVKLVEPVKLSAWQCLFTGRRRTKGSYPCQCRCKEYKGIEVCHRL